MIKYCIYIYNFVLGKPADLEDVNNPDWTPNQHMGYSKGPAIKRKTDLDRMERVKKRSKLIQKKDDIVTEVRVKKIILYKNTPYKE